MGLSDGLRQVVGASVRGTTHVRDDLPNQDAILWSPDSGIGRRLVVALSDGHGGSASFRSDVGSRAAVETAVRVGRDFVERAASEDVDSLAEGARQELPPRLVGAWVRTVEEELEQRPFTEVELRRLDGRAGTGMREAVAANGLLAYGATILLTILADSAAIFVQLGDGDILWVGLDGTVVRPLPADPQLFADQTTSLCQADAWREFRVGVHPLSPEGPAVLLMATDGFANAYLDDTGFLQVGYDVFVQLREGGMKSVAESLEGWLHSASRYSGDDVTAAVVSLAQGLPESP